MKIVTPLLTLIALCTTLMAQSTPATNPDPAVAKPLASNLFDWDSLTITPTEKGVRRGDVILSVGRASVGSAAALDRALAGVRDGQTVMLLVRRGDQTQFVAVTAGEAEAG